VCYSCNVVYRCLAVYEPHLVLGLEDGRIQTWDLERGNMLLEQAAHTGDWNALCNFS